MSFCKAKELKLYFILKYETSVGFFFIFEALEIVLSLHEGIQHCEHLINEEPTFVLIIYMWPSRSGHLKQRKSGILIRLEYQSCYIVMNLFAFHYITNYTLSNYQDCSLSFEVG